MEQRVSGTSKTLCEAVHTIRGNAPHNGPRHFVSHLVANRAAFLCTKAPMLRVPDKLSGWHPIGGQAIFRRRRQQPRWPQPAKITRDSATNAITITVPNKAKAC